MKLKTPKTWWNMVFFNIFVRHGRSDLNNVYFYHKIVIILLEFEYQALEITVLGDVSENPWD